MQIKRTVLRPVAFLAGMHAARQVRRFFAAHQHTRDVQQRLLAELLARCAETSFGLDHGLTGVRTYEEFKAAVPVSSYEDLRPYMQRVFQGETTALIPPAEQVLMFSLTSGTTGSPKRIPVTRRFLAEMRRGWNIFGWRALRDHPGGWMRGILQISSPMTETLSPTGLPCGAISGLLAATQKRIVRRMYVVPLPAFAISDPLTKYYTLLRCGVGRDVAVITTANPSSTIKLIETGQAHAEQLIRDVADGTLTPPGEIETSIRQVLRFKPNRPLAARLEEGIRRDGRLLPRHFWRPAFLTNWTGGTLGLYVRRLRELFGDVPIRDIGLLASEGRFSMPVADGTSAGIAEITSNFLEFIPAEDREHPDPPTLRAHEVEVGREYFLVVSNSAGLWRYNIDDRVHIVDRFGESPVFEFLCRGLHTANITGEKITEHQVVEAMRHACGRAGCAVDRFVMQGRFASVPYYELRLQVAGDLDADGIAKLMDEQLGKLNIEYRSKRSSGRLGPIRAAVLPAGQLQQAEVQNIRQRQSRSEQYKHQYLLTDVIRESEPA